MIRLGLMVAGGVIDEVVLGVHIAVGAAGLVIGPIAIRDAVRSVAHSRASHLYYWLVVVVCLSATALALLDWSQLWFFVPIAVASYGFAFVGHLGATRRRQDWRHAYVRGTLGAYVALITALMVVSVSGSPLTWALPTVIGVPLIHLLSHRADANVVDKLAVCSSSRPTSPPDGRESTERSLWRGKRGPAINRGRQLCPDHPLMAIQAVTIQAVSGSVAGVEFGVGLLGGIALPRSLGDDPAPGRPIDPKDRPTVAVLITQQHEHGVAVVLDAQPVGTVSLLVQDPSLVLLGVGEKGCPARAP